MDLVDWEIAKMHVHLVKQVTSKKGDTSRMRIGKESAHQLNTVPSESKV